MEQSGWEGKKSSLEGFSLPGQLDKRPYTNFVIKGKSTFKTGNRVGGDKDERTFSYYLIVSR